MQQEMVQMKKWQTEMEQRYIDEIKSLRRVIFK